MHLRGKSGDIDHPYPVQSDHLKLINQQPVKARFIFKPLLPPIREQIGSWIAEELYFLEKKQTGLSGSTVLVQPGSEVKVHTSLSVAHLSLAVKLLIDAKVITNKNSAELIRIVARNFRTDKAENISEDSLRNKSLKGKNLAASIDFEN